jgi:TRAP-type C4-dicarboxylate transport system permease small subunit
MAAAFLAAMMLLTVADVTLRTAFNQPLRGVYELIELLLAATFFVALPAVFLRDENIVVSSIDDMAPTWVPTLKRFALLLSVTVLAIMAWEGFLAARDSFEFHDVTADLGLPRVWHWLVVLSGIIGSAIAALAMALRRTNHAQEPPGTRSREQS